jgi:hypothetical protein
MELYIFVFILFMLIAVIISFISRYRKRDVLQTVKIFYDAEDKGIAIYLASIVAGTMAFFGYVMLML